jgi:hypothetical protein
MFRVQPWLVTIHRKALSWPGDRIPEAMLSEHPLSEVVDRIADIRSASPLKLLEDENATPGLPMR